ncbi:MAG: signal peptide peptidase SppA [Planctomycetota bacterium]|jgi:protease-4
MADDLVGGGAGRAGPDGRKESFPGHPAHYPTTPRKWHEKENKRLRKALAIVSAFLFIAVIMLFLQLAGGLGAGLAPPVGRITREVVREGAPDVRVAVVPVTGLIFSGSGPGLSGGTAEWVVDALEAAAEDETVKAVILEVDSPGGTITGADLIHRQVELTREGGVKVVAFFRNVAASGGYYVAAPADRIVAYPTALTGSLGVILQTFNVEGLFKKLGVEAVTVKSGEMKDMGSLFRAPTDEEKAVLQSIADEAYERFVGVVAKGRGMSVEEAKALADGRILTAKQAEAAKLVDKLGYFDDAISTAEEVGGIENATVIRYGRMPSLMDVLFPGAKAEDPAAALARFLSGLGPLYLATDVPSGGYVVPRTLGAGGR